MPGEAIVLEPTAGRTIDDAVRREPTQRPVVEAERAEVFQQPVRPGDDAVPTPIREMPGEDLEHAGPVGRAVAQRGLEHRELVPIGQQTDAHATTLGRVTMER